jgi:hypothetical protein
MQIGPPIDPKGTSRVRFAAAVISESIGIPPHLSLPWFVPATYLSLTTTNHPREQSHDDAHHCGVDGLWGAYQWLDRAPKGRIEKAIWWRRHDEYDKP